MQTIPILSLLGLVLALTIKEAFNSKGRAKLHERIDGIEADKIGERECDKTHKSVDEKLKCIPGIEKAVTRIAIKMKINLEDKN
ncbi:unnamed protein product [marine sediment metagenome]|uniref:Uncharacterized protein n=1 Tax=marine sediment metagenome TaxID=412755 RepID=X0ZNE9_9ZZZZ